jgi:hypothetical protein
VLIEIQIFGKYFIDSIPAKEVEGKRRIEKKQKQHRGRNYAKRLS